MRTLQCTVPAAFDGRPLKHLLRGELGISSTLLKTLKWARGRDPAQRRRRPCERRRPHRRYRDRRSLRARAARNGRRAARHSLAIVYEDEDLLVLNKPAGLAMHPMSTDLAAPNLAGALVAYLGEARCRTSSAAWTRAPRACSSRRSPATFTSCCAALHSEELRREYRALALGRVTPPRSIIDAPIAPRRGSLVKRCVAPDGLPSRTGMRCSPITAS